MAAAVAQVGPGRARDAHKVEAAMFEKAFVFRGHDRVHQRGRQVLVENRAALFSRAVEKIGDQFRLDFGAAHVGAAGKRPNIANGLAGELNRQAIGAREIGIFRGPNVDACFPAP